eukprot:Hpha_TRINITY_DN19123_c0_g1::TRINITY_DN19123_c0_g1_i1::g.94887::m.94887
MPTEVIPGDHRYLGFMAVVTVGMQLSFFAVAATLKFDLVTDFAGGTNFILIALLTLCLGGNYTPRQTATTSVFIVSRLWLAGFLLYRVCKRGKDDRFDEMRENPIAFLIFWIFQMFWCWTVSLPLIWLNTTPDDYDPSWDYRDYIGFSMIGVGTLFEVVSDLQKNAFRNDPANKGKVCDSGLWYISRHPNYFGEILLCWGIFVINSRVFEDNQVGWFTILGPLFTMVILLFGSGIPTGEGKSLERWYRTPESAEIYENYRNRTPPLIPFIPGLYEMMPKALKQLICFEFPLYEYPKPEGDPIKTHDAGSVEAPSGGYGSAPM